MLSSSSRKAWLLAGSCVLLLTLLYNLEHLRAGFLQRHPFPIPLASYTAEDVKQFNEKILKVPPFRDVNLLGNCPMKANRPLHFRLLKWWTDFAGGHNFTWFVTYGSLIGAQRGGDMVPWDSDTDIGVMEADVAELVKLQNRRAYRPHLINLVCRPAGFCPYNAERMTCGGHKTMKMRDACSFCSPVCRVVTRGGHLDLWIYNPEVDKLDNKLKVYDEGMSEYRKTKRYMDVDVLFPLRVCKFLGLTVLCPNKPQDYLRIVYSDTKPKFRCHKSKWLLKDSSPKKIRRK